MTDHPASPLARRDEWRHLARQSPVGPVAGRLLDAATALPIGRLLRWLENRPTLQGLALATLGLRKPIFIDHPHRPEPRFGQGRPDHLALRTLVEDGRERYAERLKRITALGDRLAAIPLRGDPGGAEPYWDNGWLPPLDALALYGLLAEHRPRRYVEVGSGNSTRFARRAITDHALPATITSIDPAPRASIDALCDTVVRRPLQDADLSVFADLGPGDIVFLDGSHRVLMGSDVTVFFFEVLPLLRPGVLVHLHDIFLPDDYPPQWRWRYYSEQYLLAAFLLADQGALDIELPNAFVAGDAGLSATVTPLWNGIGVRQHYLPGSFWMTVRRTGAGVGEGSR